MKEQQDLEDFTGKVKKKDSLADWRDSHTFVFFTIYSKYMEVLRTLLAIPEHFCLYC